MAARIKTNFPGVYYYVQPRLGGTGTEKVFYVVFKLAGKVREEVAGRQYRDDMTAARASYIRASLIEGKRELAKEKREREKAEKDADVNRPTIAHLWTLYKEARPNIKGILIDESRFKSYIEPVFADKTPAEIDPLSVDRFRVKLGKLLTPKSTSNTLELLRRIINFGVNGGLCESKVKIRLPRVDNLQTEDLSPDQLTRLLEVLDSAENQGVSRIMRMALFTGMRRGEILKLRWGDLDFERGFICIRDPKGGLSAKIPMGTQARDMLLSIQRESDFVFPGRGGKQRVDLLRAARKLCEAAGLPRDFRPMHGLRHAFASMLASSGQVDLYTLQRLLTHKTASMTTRYAHLRDEVLQRAANVAGQIMEDAQAGQDKKVVNLEDFRKG